MRSAVLGTLIVGIVTVGAGVTAQNKPSSATYITKEQVDTVNKQQGTDRTIRVLDIGHENFAVGIIHRGPSGAAAAGGAAAAAGRGAAPAVAPEPCGERAE